MNLVIHDMMAIKSLISDIKKIAPAEIADKNDRGQVQILCDGVRRLMIDVSSMIKTSKIEIACRGDPEERI